MLVGKIKCGRHVPDALREYSELSKLLNKSYSLAWNDQSAVVTPETDIEALIVKLFPRLC